MSGVALTLGCLPSRTRRTTILPCHPVRDGSRSDWLGRWLDSSPPTSHSADRAGRPAVRYSSARAATPRVSSQQPVVDRPPRRQQVQDRPRILPCPSGSRAQMAFERAQSSPVPRPRQADRGSKSRPPDHVVVDGGSPSRHEAAANRDALASVGRLVAPTLTMMSYASGPVSVSDSQPGIATRNAAGSISAAQTASRGVAKTVVTL